MKPAFFILFLAAVAAAGSAQTGTKTHTTNIAALQSFAQKPAAPAASAPEAWITLPPGVPEVTHAPVHISFALRYEDIVVGTGPEGEPGKLWHIKYNGWRAADGVKFDSWEDHPQPVMGPDGKPELGPDGKPKPGEPQPIAVQQGVGRVIPGLDLGLEGMRVGGKRRLFIPWQLAYGSRVIADRPDHPGIPAKSDIIFDVELVDVTDAPQPPRPPMPANRSMPPPNPGAAPSAPANPAAPAHPATPPPQ